MTSLTERELSRTQFKSMVVMVRHVVEEVCKDEAVQISGRKQVRYDVLVRGVTCYARGFPLFFCGVSKILNI